jgi:hypothetical protein
MEIIEKIVSARRQRSDPHRDLAIADHDLLAPEIGAFELRWNRIVVLDHKLHALAGRHSELRRHEAVIFEDQNECRLVAGPGSVRRCQKDEAQ